ncbi:heterokaryon incompatibility [Pyrenophora seminiperda CCB06]|uniref:Heterokaryon incompatibility n=1 Tax=Pyrenophora seminiperda CCB06 TaxID=1302712 RepID=A0A3M7M789_9PLEO|nr:heterokaryon incompatibility [Pyrenophora seminiperda CCB06]
MWSVYVAPSWSWASVDGSVRASLRGAEKYAIHVEDVVLAYATDDVTGAVTDGWLDIRGSLKPMKLQRFDHEYHGTPWSMTINTGFGRKQGNSNEDYEQDDASKPVYVQLDIAPTSEVEFDEDNAGERLFFMPISEPQDWAVQHSLSLMLRLVDVATPSFQRIGIIET